jgi:hypothetical protein
MQVHAGTCTLAFFTERQPIGHYTRSKLIKADQSQSKSIKLEKCFQQGLIGSDGGPNRQFLPFPAPDRTLNLEL